MAQPKPIFGSTPQAAEVAATLSPLALSSRRRHLHYRAPELLLDDKDEQAHGHFEDCPFDEGDDGANVAPGYLQGRYLGALAAIITMAALRGRFRVGG
jgi:hypothetical protein